MGTVEVAWGGCLHPLVRRFRIHIVIRRLEQQRSKYSQLIQVRTKKKPNGPLVPAKTLVEGRVTTWSLTRMPIPLPINQALVAVRVWNQPRRGVSWSMRLRWWSLWPLSFSVSHRDLQPH